MPRRNDINKVMIIGSGPIVVGQACEFDYSGTQACKALRGLGYEIVLVNSNPATIMTDPGMADVTYIEPLNLEAVTQIIEKERPDALLPNLGGQTGLNLSAELARSGVLDKYGVKVIGVEVDAIVRGEDRTEFKKTMERLGIEVLRSEAVYTVEDAEKVAATLGYPVVVRPAYCLGGTGSGLVYNVEELRTVASRGIAASLIGQVLIEESVLGWEELELEVVRDAKNQMITVCFIENVDAMGVHTGDSYCTAPMLTIDTELQKRLQEYSYKIVEAIRVIGGTNIQFAHDPQTGQVVVIEINPRTSRSSALASKATGFPITLVSSKLAAGLTLDEIPLIVRPSHVLGGRGMEVVWNEEMLKEYVAAAVDVTPDRPILIDKFLENAIEVEADAIADGTSAFVPAVIEHIELAGVHSGDSAFVIPPVSLAQEHIDTIYEYTQKIARELNVIGLMNIQYAIANNVVYVLEANPRASRTVPLVSKVCNVSMARSATQLMLGKKLNELGLKPRVIPHFGVKEAVFPFNMFPEVDPLLGPEMRSTGEVLGIAHSFGIAFFKTEEAAQQLLPTDGTVLIIVSTKDRPAVAEVAKQFAELGFKIKATQGTHQFLASQGIKSAPILKMHEGRPNIVDAIKNGEIQLAINTPSGKLGQHNDSYIRKAAIKYNRPYITTLAAANATARGISAYRQGKSRVKALQSYHADIK